MIRECKLEDIPNLNAINDQVLKTKYEFEYEMLSNPYATVYGLFIDDKMIGYCDLWITFERGEIARIAVLEEYQHKGYGQEMMTFMENKCMESGCENIQLEVRESNLKAINLYQKNGFITLYTRENYYGNENGLVMMKGI